MKEVLIMELIKALPEIFEDFAEQRKKSFLTMKELKDRDVPVVGAYCTYFPQEIAMAMGAVTVGLCSLQTRQYQWQRRICQEICALW